MEIKVEASVVLDVLIDNDIDVAQAKAIVFDLMQATSGAPIKSTREILAEARAAAKARSPLTADAVEEEAASEPPVAIGTRGPSKVQLEEYNPSKSSKPSKSKRLSFSQFGGAADKIIPSL